MLRCIFSLAAFVTISFSYLAQDSSTGAIRGTVLDPSRNRVAGATLALVNDATGAHYEQTSGHNGQFAFELLPQAITLPASLPRVCRHNSVPAFMWRLGAPATLASNSQSLELMRVSRFRRSLGRSKPNLAASHLCWMSARS